MNLPSVRWWPWASSVEADVSRFVRAYRDTVPGPYERAQDLLLSMLNQQQKATYLTAGYFEIRGSHGGQWRIWKGNTGNTELRHTRGWRSYCAAPRGEMPDPDVCLGQMLAIVTDEASFLRAANPMGEGHSHYAFWGHHP